MPKIRMKKEFNIYIQHLINYCKFKDLSVKTIKEINPLMA